jgi:metal-responsive CopG/Arc/MetJ family transcriptional regulator
MSKVKTAISLDEDIFKKANNLANKMNISRSQFISRALENFLKEFDNQALLNKINECYEEYEVEEIEYLDKMKKYRGQKLNVKE